MARFQFNLRSLITTQRADPNLAQRTLRQFVHDDVATSPQGPGWFDSSYELSSGLEVDEGQPGDSRYDDWLAARALVERRLAAHRAAARSPRKTAPTQRRVADAELDLAGVPDIGDLARAVPVAPAPAGAQDDFSRFGIDDLALA